MKVVRGQIRHVPVDFSQDRETFIQNPVLAGSKGRDVGAGAGCLIFTGEFH
jgi:hypothetical protein